MQLLVAVATLLTGVRAFSKIAMFGDSLSDDCTHGASRLIDDFYDTDQENHTTKAVSSAMAQYILT